MLFWYVFYCVLVMFVVVFFGIFDIDEFVVVVVEKVVVLFIMCFISWYNILCICKFDFNIWFCYIVNSF